MRKGPLRCRSTGLGRAHAGNAKYKTTLGQAGLCHRCIGHPHLKTVDLLPWVLTVQDQISYSYASLNSIHDTAIFYNILLIRLEDFVSLCREVYIAMLALNRFGFSF